MKFLSVSSLIVGLLLLGLNITGLLIPLRAPEITADYPDFARDHTPSFKTSMAQLKELSTKAEPSLEFITEVTRVFHYGIAHIPPEDIRAKGLAHYRMQVPVWENYILYALSYLDPATFRDYEFCSYQRALERGTGRCGQQSMALADYLDAQGINTGYVGLGGHALAAAQTADGNWIILDPDYGGVIPFDLKTAEQNPDSVIPHYWNQSVVVNNGLHRLFEPEHNFFKAAPPESRQPNTCKMEVVAYLAKWLIPIACLLFSGLIFAVQKPRKG